MVKDARGFVKPPKEYRNPVQEAKKKRIEWIDNDLNKGTPVHRDLMVNVIARKFGLSNETASQNLYNVVDGFMFHFCPKGMINKGGKAAHKCEKV